VGNQPGQHQESQPRQPEPNSHAEAERIDLKPANGEKEEAETEDRHRPARPAAGHTAKNGIGDDSPPAVAIDDGRKDEAGNENDEEHDRERSEYLVLPRFRRQIIPGEWVVHLGTAPTVMDRSDRRGV